MSHSQNCRETVLARSVASNVEVIDRYFDLLEQTLIDNNLLDSPSQIFNCDETELCLEHTPSSVVAVRGQKHPRALTSGRNKLQSWHVQMLLDMLFPLVIFARKSLNFDLTIDEVPGTMYGLSDNGWIDMEIFENWFIHHFFSSCAFVQTTSTTT